MRLAVTGETAQTAHTGPTPMDQRRNALVGAACLIAPVSAERLERIRGRLRYVNSLPDRPPSAHDASSRRRSRHCSGNTPVMTRNWLPRPVISSSFSTE